MPKKATIAKARADKRQGKAVSTQAGEFVKEEIDLIRHGVHGARSTQQAIAIGLSKARRAGVELPPPPAGKTSIRTRKQAARDSAKGRSGTAARPVSKKRSRASLAALKREGREAASPRALGRHAKAAAAARSPKQRSAAAKRAAKTRADR